MKVFLSWSGERSQLLAQALREWLPLILHYVEPWISNSDIEAGERWAVEVAKELETSNSGLICVTRENVSSPWILFEAGALAKSMQEGRVTPVLLDIEFQDIAGPLAQFQAKKFSKQGILESIKSINRFAQAPIPEARILQLFEPLWPQLETKVEAIPQSETRARNRPQPEILEELVSGIRGLDVRLRENLEEPSSRSRTRRGRNIEFMMDFVTHELGLKNGDPFALVILTSLFRDKIPWLYELAMENYRAISSARHPQAIQQARHRLSQAFMMLRRGPMLEMLTDGSKSDYIMFKEIERFMRYEEFFQNEDVPKVKATRTNVEGKSPSEDDEGS